MPNFPEHDRLRPVKEQSQAIGEFLDWLRNSRHISLMTWQDAGDNGEPPYLSDDGKPTHSLTDDDPWVTAPNPAFEMWDEDWVRVRLSNTELLAEYFGIDLKALEAEKRAMLELMRAKNAESEQRNV